MQGSRLKKKKIEMVRHRYHLTPSEDIVDLRILKFDWTRGTPDITQPTEMLLFLDDYPHTKNQRHVFFPMLIKLLKELMLMKELFNLIGQEVLMATHNQKW